VKKILIIGGGTGGHLNPGIALYEEFKAKNLGVLFLAAKQDRKFPSLREVNLSDLFFYGAPTFSRNIFKLLFFVPRFVFSILKTIKIIKHHDVGAVIGMGGYVSAPALIAAIFNKIPIFLCEQNSYPGKVTLWFEKYAERVYATFAVSIKHLKFEHKFKHVGNPLRQKVFRTESKEEARKFFNLEYNQKVILVIGGSQGALSLNQLFWAIKKKYPEEFKNIGVIWSIGSFSYDKFKSLLEKDVKQGSFYISPFIEQVGLAYKASDLALSRSGAGVMMELAVNGIPAVYIPYPYAAKDHQRKNAEAFAEAGAALKIDESEAEVDKVASLIFNLLNNKRSLFRMSEKARELAKKESAALIVEDILEFIK